MAEADSYPHDLMAEQQVLGALLVRPSLLPRIHDLLKSNDWFLASHRIIYDTLLELFHRVETKGNIDSIRVIQYLQDRSQLEAAGGDTYIMSLAENVVSPQSAPLHSERIKQMSIRRQLIDAARLIEKSAKEPISDEGSFLRKVETEILKITNSDVVHTIVPIQEIREEFKKHIYSLIESKGTPQGTVTGFSDFDKLTGGLQGGQLIVLAARPGAGKTTLALNIAANVAEDNKVALIYSLEMSNLELVMRLICSESQINSQKLQTGEIDARYNTMLTDAILHVTSLPIYINDSGDLSIWDCMTQTRKFKVEMDQRNKEIGIIIVDYLQLMNDPDARKMGRQQEVASISRSLKQLAKATNTPILALSQMNRSVEQRRGESARPLLSDLRESGAIEQDADIVMFLHDPSKSTPETDPDFESKKGMRDLIIAKHRNGAMKDIKLSFRPEINRFDHYTDPDTDSSGNFGPLSVL